MLRHFQLKMQMSADKANRSVKRKIRGLGGQSNRNPLSNFKWVRSAAHATYFVRTEIAYEFCRWHTSKHLWYPRVWKVKTWAQELFPGLTSQYKFCTFPQYKYSRLHFSYITCAGHNTVGLTSNCIFGAAARQSYKR